MLTQLTTLKERLKIDAFDLTDDALLTRIIQAVSGRFDRQCNRTFARTSGATEEFGGEEMEILVGCYPIESVTSWHLKDNETEGWEAQTGVDYLIRRSCVLSLKVPLGDLDQQGRVTYTGGYVLPGTTAESGQTELPSEIEQACIDQCVFLFQKKDQLGITSLSGGGAFKQFIQLDLLPNVEAVLQKYTRMKL